MHEKSDNTDILTLLHSEKAKIAYNFGLSECNRIKYKIFHTQARNPHLACYILENLLPCLENKLQVHIGV